MTNSIDVNGNKFSLTPDRTEFLDELISKFGSQTSFTRTEIKELNGWLFPSWMKDNKFGFKEPQTEGTLLYNLQAVISGYNGGYSHGGETEVKVPPVPAATPSNMPVWTATESVNLLDEGVKIIPEKMSNYVPFGHFKDVKNIIKSKIFFPVFVTGLSGNGKTLMVEQVCAQLKRELYRVNITIETDEDDLMGGHSLVNGNIVFREGPSVIKAYEERVVLLLDEVDLGSNKLMCLQSVLEGKGYLIKKTGEWVTPKKGFTILATANTKGQGSEDGKFIGTQIMNESMLERFAITMQQEYPPVKTERSILSKEMELTGEVDQDFCEKLVDWIDVIRKTFYEGGIDDVVTTRRLVHIVNAYRMFGDKLKSIEMCISRFDEETRNSILDLYTKVDEGVNLNGEEETVEETSENPVDETDY